MTLTGLASLLVGCLDGARPRGDKLLRLTNGSQPKTVEVGKVVTGATRSLALYEGVSSEILHAATRRRQRLAAALITCPGVLKRKVQQVHITVGIAFFFHTQSFFITLTRRKEYPVQRLLQPGGHAGTVWSWLWKATAGATVSHTTQRLMWELISWPTSGIMGMGAVVESQ